MHACCLSVKKNLKYAQIIIIGNEQNDKKYITKKILSEMKEIFANISQTKDIKIERQKRSSGLRHC